MKIDLNKSAPENCPRFEHCNINRCVLNPDYKKLQNDESDYAIGTKEHCIPKKKRMEIGASFSLENKGLKEREFAAMKKWDSMSLEARETKKQELRENSPFLKLKSKGYAITRIGEKEEKLTLPNEAKPPILSEEKPTSESKEPLKVKPEFTPPIQPNLKEEAVTTAPNNPVEIKKPKNMGSGGDF